MKPDERALLEDLGRRADLPHDQRYVREMVAERGMNEKRACYICFKWTDKGWYDYGVNVLSGWLTPEGRAAALPPEISGEEAEEPE